MLGRRDTASAIFFRPPIISIGERIASQHTYPCGSCNRAHFFVRWCSCYDSKCTSSSSYITFSCWWSTSPEVVLRLRVGDLHLPGHVVRHAARALRLRVCDLHLPGVRYVSALVIYICQSPCFRRADPWPGASHKIRGAMRKCLARHFPIRSSNF